MGIVLVLSIHLLHFIIVQKGCDSGFGCFAAEKLSSLGFFVIAGCLTPEGANRISSVVGAAFVCDVTKLEDVENLMKQTKDILTTNDLSLWAVVNNAGILQPNVTTCLTKVSQEPVPSDIWTGILSLSITEP